MKYKNILVICLLFLTYAYSHSACAPEPRFSHNIQEAINNVHATGGGVVHIPKGEFVLDGDIFVKGNIKLIGAGTDSTILYTKDQSTAIKASGSNIRISGFSLINDEYKGGNGIIVEECIDFRIDNLHIEGYSNQAAVFVDGSKTRGVIDHCTIKAGYSEDLGYGVVVYRDNLWEEDMRLGTEFAVFIEDSHFTNCRHSVAGNSGAHYVFRHNEVVQGTIAHAVDAHGPTNVGDGNRCAEIYNNTIKEPMADGAFQAIGIRGGGGVIFNNNIEGYTYGVMLKLDDRMAASYPAYHQVHDLYIWDNLCDGLEDVNVQENGLAREFIQQDRDFFLYPMNDYIPYTYPHPLTSI